jgi:serine/threonine protein kinase
MPCVVTRDSPTKIANYAILGRIRHTGQGSVYKGRDPCTGNIVAIKVLSGQMANDPVLRLRFAQECQVMRRLRHPHIARVLDFGLDGDKPYLVMEYIEGETLAELLKSGGPLTEAKAVALISQIGQALQWAHERGLIHRDVTPDNILVTEKNAAMLTDLGLVKDLDGDFNLTRTQSTLGTPHFIAPEQFENAKHADALSDLYALAATLYLALTGELPFRTKSSFAIGAIYKKKLTDSFETPRQLNPEVSERVSNAICRALRADRAERFASVLAFVEALAEPVPIPVQVSLRPGTSTRAKKGSGDSESGNRERRKKPRVTTKVGAVCRPFERDTVLAWRGSLIDLSETGLCLQLNRKFEPGTNLTISLGGKKLRRRSLLARVLWVQRCSERVWRMGCNFDQPLTWQEICDLA